MISQVDYRKITSSQLHKGCQGTFQFPTKLTSISKQKNAHGLLHMMESRLNKLSLDILIMEGQLIFQEMQQVLTILVAVHGMRQKKKLGSIDEIETVGYLLGAGDHHALAVLNRLDKVAGLQKSLMGAGIQPGNTSTKHFDAHLAT